MSSSSSAPEPDGLASFLARSLELVRRDAPRAYEAICAHLGARAIAVRVSREGATLRCDGRAIAVHAELLDAAAIAVRADRRTVLALLDGEDRLVDAARAGRLSLRASAADLIAFHDALMAYVGGAVRSPGMPSLLGSYRGAARAREGEHGQGADGG